MISHTTADLQTKAEEKLHYISNLFCTIATTFKAASRSKMISKHCHYLYDIVSKQANCMAHKK